MTDLRAVFVLQLAGHESAPTPVAWNQRDLLLYVPSFPREARHLTNRFSIPLHAFSYAVGVSALEKHTSRNVSELTHRAYTDRSQEG